MPDPGYPTSLGNWQDPPLNRWSFLHVDRILPTSPVGRCGAPTHLFATAPRELEGQEIDSQEIDTVPVARVSGHPGTVADVLRDSETDAFVVLHRGVLVHESYPNANPGELPANSRHLLMSVTKSFVGAVTGILADRGMLELDGQVTRHVPEVIGSGYDGATIRHLLDMRSGIAFSEQYLNPDADVRMLEHAAGWRPYQPGLPTSTYEYVSRLPANGLHGGGFRYRSCETDLLGWVCERASGSDMATLLSRLIWRRLGMENDAYIAVDLAGTAVHDGGLCATARDVARFGQLLLDDGRSVSGEQILPAGWTADVLAGAPDGRDAFTATSSIETGMPGGHYRHQFWVPFADGRVLLALGIHGQMVFVDQLTGTVGIKLSSWPMPQDAVRFHDSLSMFRAIAARLAGTDRNRPDQARTDHFAL